MIIITGGGLLGMLTAAELARSGQQVTLLERTRTGTESTWAGGGILSPLYPWRYPDPVTELSRWSQAHYPEFAALLARESGVDPEWTESGLLMLDPEEAATAVAWAGRFGYELELTEGRSVEPALVRDGKGIWMPRIAQMRNPRLAQALRAWLPKLGVIIREGCAVTGLRTEGAVVTGVLTDQGFMAADRVVVAAGAWTRELLAPFGAPPAVEPVKGQMILFRAEPGVLRRIVMHQGRYLIPRRDGRILTGSTLEHAGFDKSTTAEALEELRAAALSLVPALGRHPVETQWAGLRPGSPDGVPYIGEHPQIGGLFVNAGHYRNGVVMGLASARLAADLLLGRPPVVDPTPYAMTTPRGT